ncbi:MAG: cell division protein FtsQ/DivIB [Methyloceanibacter sp.]|uniref:cell division protein FtsQ/DivIB n=1 Tax=Methyloceanibacter sp. TaxID=1965321 RepID=UPI003EE0781A
MARGIAVPRERRLPVLSGTRALVTRSPKAIRLGRARDRMQGKWLLFSVLFLGSAVLYGAIIGGQTGRLFDAAVTGVERLVVAVGFGVKRVTVDGQTNVTDSAITTALAAGPETLMLAFDTDAAKARLEAVPWIRHAQVMRLLPSTLQVIIEEREPYAVWQNQGKTFVVDEAGVVLAPALPQAFPQLPLVVGEGASKHAAELYATLEPYHDLKRKMLAALRVGDRRWTLKLRTGAEIMLPDGNIEMALESLTKLEQERNVLGRDFAAIDLRLLDRITVRMREAATIPLDETGPADVPTAATGAAPKGKT